MRSTVSYSTVGEEKKKSAVAGAFTCVCGPTVRIFRLRASAMRLCNRRRRGCLVDDDQGPCRAAKKRGGGAGCANFGAKVVQPGRGILRRGFGPFCSGSSFPASSSTDHHPSLPPGLGAGGPHCECCPPSHLFRYLDDSASHAYLLLRSSFRSVSCLGFICARFYLLFFFGCFLPGTCWLF